MYHDTGKRALEKYKIFPYIAWGLVFGFTFFVYTLVSELQNITAELQAQTTALQQQVANDLNMTDFDDYNNRRYQPSND